MAVKAQCPECGKAISAPDSYLHKTMKCPKCGKNFKVFTDSDIAIREHLEEVPASDTKNNEQEELDLSIPKGFRMIAETPELLYIQHKYPERSCLLPIMTVFFFFFTIMAIGFIASVNKTSPSLGYLSCIIALPVFLIELIFGIALLWMFFKKTEFIMTQKHLQVTKGLFRWKKSCSWHLDEIDSFFHIEEPSEFEGGLPTWGLVFYTDKKNVLLTKQDYEKSLWLGTILKKWSGKRFHTVPDTSYGN